MGTSTELLVQVLLGFSCPDRHRSLLPSPRQGRKSDFGIDRGRISDFGLSARSDFRLRYFAHKPITGPAPKVRQRPAPRHTAVGVFFTTHTPCRQSWAGHRIALVEPRMLRWFCKTYPSYNLQPLLLKHYRELEEARAFNNWLGERRQAQEGQRHLHDVSRLTEAVHPHCLL